MSWNIGSQLATTDSGPCSNRSRMSRWLWRTLACVTITPFGESVDPDVYWRRARVSPPTSGNTHAGSGPARTSSVVTISSAAASPSRRPTVSARAAVVRMTAGRASATIASRRARERRPPTGAGTAVAPA
jgi:hypothetical protein